MFDKLFVALTNVKAKRKIETGEIFIQKPIITLAQNVLTRVSGWMYS